MTPFAWSRPHPVNEHVAAAPAELERRGHEVVVLAPSSRAKRARGRAARAPAAGARRRRRSRASSRSARRCRSRGGAGIGRAGRSAREPRARARPRPLRRRPRARARPAEPLLPRAPRRAAGSRWPPSTRPSDSATRPAASSGSGCWRAIDALTATSDEVAERRRSGSRATTSVLPLGVEPTLFGPRRARQRFVLEWRPDELPRTRAAAPGARRAPGWELVVLRTRPLSGRPYVPRGVRGRVLVRTARDATARARELAGAAGLVPPRAASSACGPRREAAGVPLVDPPGADEQPELVGAALARLAEDEGWRRESAARARTRRRGAERRAARRRSSSALYGSVLGKRRRALARADPLADRPWILCDLHLHTEHSHDCAMPFRAARLRGGDRARRDRRHRPQRLRGAPEAVELARGRAAHRDPGRGGEDRRGRGDRALPPGGDPARHVDGRHDRRDPRAGRPRLPPPPLRPPAHDPGRRRRCTGTCAEIDVFEVYNARLLFEASTTRRCASRASTT